MSKRKRGQGEAEAPVDPKLIATYFEEWADRRRQDQPANRAVHDLVRDEPEEAWKVLLALIEHAPDDAALAYVAAGPLEELLVAYGTRVIERVETMARRDRRFRDALEGVWQSTIPDAIWERVTRFRKPPE
jgi:hypothetical protein